MEWNFSQPYRTETWLKELEGRELKTPICIPSYKRPDAPILSKKGFIRNTPELTRDKVFVFIRDTEEEYQSYKWAEEFVTLVPLPNHVKEIGLTREAILQWGIKHNYHNLFMFDDRLLSLKVLAPYLTRNNKLVMGKYSGSTNYKALLLWEYFHKIFTTTVSGVNNWNICWCPKNINRQFMVNNPGSSWTYMNLDLDDCKKYDLHFYDTREKGIEDVAFMYNTMIKGLPSRLFTDISFTDISPETLHEKTITSGGNASYPKLNRFERLAVMIKKFWENTLNTKWPNTPTGFYVYKNDLEKMRFRFEWTKYWSKYYEEHKVK